MIARPIGLTKLKKATPFITYQKSQSLLKIFGENFEKKIGLFFPSANLTKFLESFGYHKIDPKKKTCNSPCIILICGFHFCGKKHFLF
jgi:hypothetical protein